MEPSLRGLIAELRLSDAVHFTGPLSEKEKDECLRQAHFLLHTSVREGWGLNVIEANAMGTPAAVYPVPGLIESTLHNQTGFVAKAEDPQALADALAAAIGKGDLYESLRRQAWARAKTFHWTEVLPKACAWLEALAAGKRTPGAPA